VPDVTARPSAGDIYTRVAEDAREELARPAAHLAFSGLFAGMTIGFSGLAVAAALVQLGGASGAHFVAALLYPVGFLAVILGRAQLFTENTLYPVVLVLEDHRRHLGPTARLWAVVLATNLAGALVFALLVVETGAVSADLQRELGRLGDQALAGGFFPNFWSGLFAGWLIALIAWLVEASDAAIGRFVVISVLSFVVGLASFDHSIASAAETMTTMFAGDAGVGEVLGWLAAVTLGNVVGGVLIVAVMNYGQVRSH